MFGLLRVVKDNSQHRSVAAAQAADAMTEFRTIETARSSHRTFVPRENYAIPLAQRNDLHARLSARSPLRQQEFTTGEIALGDREQKRRLQRENVLAVKVLMKAVVIICNILKQERRRPGLSGAMTSVEKRR